MEFLAEKRKPGCQSKYILPPLRLLDFVLNLPQKEDQAAHSAGTAGASIQAPYHVPEVTLNVRHQAPKG